MEGRELRVEGEKRGLESWRSRGERTYGGGVKEGGQALGVEVSAKRGWRGALWTDECERGDGAVCAARVLVCF